MVPVAWRSADILGDAMNNNQSKKIAILMALSCLFAMASFETVEARAACSEGRTASGKCIKPVMAAVQRKIMVAFTQPKISQSSKLISAVAAPAQIMASVQNVTVAQTSASTFEKLRGPSSYEAQPHYNTTLIPDVYSLNGIYLTQAQFAEIQTLFISYFNNPSSLTPAQINQIGPYFPDCNKFVNTSTYAGVNFSNVLRRT